MYFYRLCVAVWFALLPLPVWADGVNAGLADPVVVPTVEGLGVRQSPVTAITRVDPNTGQHLIYGSNQVGRPGIAPDQIGGYEANIAYDHVAVAAAVIGVLFVMTEWMDVR